MLKGIPYQISPELLKVLDEMGHTDELVIADGNFPGSTMGTRVIRADGMGVPELLDAILQLFPLDTYPNSKGEEDPPCTLMALEPGDVGKVATPIWDEYKKIVAKYDERGEKAFKELGGEKCLSHLLNSPGNFTAAKLAWSRRTRLICIRRYIR